MECFLKIMEGSFVQCTTDLWLYSILRFNCRTAAFPLTFLSSFLSASLAIITGSPQHTSIDHLLPHPSVTPNSQKMSVWTRLVLRGLNRPFIPTSVRFIRSSGIQRAVFVVSGEKEFKEKVLESKKHVVVDFHADWCNPCVKLAPVLLKVVESRQGKVDLAKIDIDKNQELALRYGVASIPTVLLMADGELKDSFVGLQSEDDLERFVPKSV